MFWIPVGELGLGNVFNAGQFQTTGYFGLLAGKVAIQQIGESGVECEVGFLSDLSAELGNPFAEVFRDEFVLKMQQPCCLFLVIVLLGLTLFTNQMR